MYAKRFDRRTLLRGSAALGAAALAPWMSACAEPDENALSFFFAANPEEADARRRVITEFGRRHPDIPVRIVLSGPDPVQQMSTFCAGGRCPDVLMAWELTYATLADRGVLLDLNTLAGQDPDFTDELHRDSIDSLYRTFTFDGGQYALPEQWSGNFLYYNKKLFTDAGLPSPPSRWEQSWTFAEFLTAAQALTKRTSSGAVTQWGFVDTWVPTYSAGLFAMNNGAQWCQPRTNPEHLNFDDDAFLDGVQFYADLAARHRVSPTAIDAQSMSTMDLFVAGKAAMALAGHWRYQSFSGADGLDFDITTLPVGPRGTRACSNIGTTGLAIAADSRHHRQAWQFVKFAAGPVGQALIGKTGLFVPVLKSALGSAGFADAHSRIGHLAVLTDGPTHSGYLPITPSWPKIDALMDRSFGPVLRGTTTAQSLKAGLSRDVDRVLSGA
ncbi:multiple sugar transport system substrate-binding protein [Mycobacterium sp. MAA66]|uniref:ABC transporter substrate-binding protein n=1 Tax=Mycobacterium sp. MAA66 TaxID=3156297 RepID=UPI0035197627